MTSIPANARLTPAYYFAHVNEFLRASSNEILGALASSHGTLEETQRSAWQIQIQVLKAALENLDGVIYLEFEVPRLGSRIDAVLVSGSAILPMEFKCGEKKYSRAHYEQAWDYALDLKNFHEGSHRSEIFPLLVATEAEAEDLTWEVPHNDGVRPPFRCNAKGLARALTHGRELATGTAVDGVAWGQTRYRPTPTIIEAARALYARHAVDAIARQDAGAANLASTGRAVNTIIEATAARHEKAILFITGVPGSGKTRVGLDIATKRRERNETHAMYLSGNQPLVAVLQEALVRDEVSRAKADNRKIRKGTVHQSVKAFIQNVHHFRDDGLRNPNDAPDDHIVIFDEAQRAWNLKKTANFMKQRKGRAGFTQSEPEFLISYMDRHVDWAIVVCLVGGGQEINTGESGISAWLEAVRTRFPNWRVHVSPQLSGAEYQAATELAALYTENRITACDELHLATSVRSFRSEKVSAFVHALLNCDARAASQLLSEVGPQYPIVVTRDLGQAKTWIKNHARGSERYGLVASSEAQRLKPLAIDVRVRVNPVHWFLNGSGDTRSSFYMEDAATEFQIQGLELDWVCMTWDADLRMDSVSWRFHSFRGDRWTTVHDLDRRRYLLNAYRVLLTRARQGMAIFVPPGDPVDSTRRAAFYDETFAYLRGVGIPEA